MKPFSITNGIEPHRESAHLVFGRPLMLVLIAAYKVMWGTAEIASGLVVFLSLKIIASELAEDPQDLLANWILTHIKITPAGAQSLGLVLVILGLMKIVVAIGLWYRSWRVRNVMLAFFVAITLFGLYNLSQHVTALRLLTVAADGLIALYLWKIMPKHLPARYGIKKSPSA